jgi:hypothetical protein
MAVGNHLQRSSPQSGDMFIETRSLLIISAKSEMLSISLLAKKKGAVGFL